MLTIDELKKSVNVAELLSDDKLARIAGECVRGYDIDEDSRESWKSTVKDAMDIAMQVMEEKSFPWQNASNIKFPLITQASIDYASRTIPEIIQNEYIVKINVEGLDSDGAKYRRATRVADYISYDLVCRSPDWVEGMDKLLQILPVLGTVFKKTYYSDIERRNCSDLCSPDKICVNYGVQSLESARRVTHLLTFYQNDIITRQRKGIFLEKFDNGKPLEAKSLSSNGEGIANDDCDKPLTFLEQHCWLDLDEDGYKEPYIVTLHKDSKQIFRIVSRFKSVELNKNNKVVQIVPEQYFTDYHFIRSPDGGFYSMGFGSLLLPLNNAINSLINMLIDSGTLNTVQGGIIGKGIRLKNGELQFKMGRWQYLDCASGDDISKQIFPWPTKEPSQTLFQLLGLLMQVGKDLTSSTDILNGKQPAQNVAGYTASQLIEQGTKVFIAINKRVYRSLKKEYQKLLELYSKHTSNKDYQNVLDDPEADTKTDFDLSDLNIYPIADPSLSTASQKISRAGMVQQLRTVDPREADIYFLESMQLDQSTIDRLLPKQDPNAPPPPDVQKVMAEIAQIQITGQNIQAQIALQAQKMQLDQVQMQQNIKESEARIANYAQLISKSQQDALHNLRKDGITTEKMQSQETIKAATLGHKIKIDDHEAALKEVQVAHEIAKTQGDLQIKEREIENDRAKD